MQALIKGLRWRNHMIGLAGLGFSLILLAIAGLLNHSERSALKKAQQQYQAQLTINRNASDAKDELDRYLTIYHAWQDQGLFAEPQRLSWLETLKSLAEHYQIPRIEFELQSSYAAEITDTSFWRETIPITLTPMTMNVRFAHEEDMSNLFTALRRDAKGVFDVKQCELTHLNEDSRMNAEVSLLAQCELTWYSLADVTQKWADYEQVAE
jgi:hypothetical protein